MENSYWPSTSISFIKIQKGRGNLPIMPVALKL